MSDNLVQMYSLANLQKIRDNFIEELNLSNLGNQTSLAFTKNPLPNNAMVQVGEVFQVMVIGGSKFESALLKKTGENLQILNQYKSNVPSFKTKEIFLSFLEENLDQNVKVVALNFAVGLKPKIRNGLLDGIRTGKTTKGHEFKGLSNNTIGEKLEKYIFIKKHRTIRVSCANDTICLLLAGLKKSYFDNLIAGIVGSGINFAFFSNKNTAITLESARFDKFNQTLTGKIVDEQSLQPGIHLFEKEVAGAYLYKHFNVLKNQLDKKNKEIKSTLELDEIAKDENHPNQKTAQKLFERSASLVACQMAGIYYFKEKSEARNSNSEANLNNQNSNDKKILNLKYSNFDIVSNLDIRYSNFCLTFAMEGSLFWNDWNYKKMVEKYLHLLDVPEHGIKFVQINQSGIIGAAQLLIGQD